MSSCKAFWSNSFMSSSVKHSWNQRKILLYLLLIFLSFSLQTGYHLNYKKKKKKQGKKKRVTQPKIPHSFSWALTSGPDLKMFPNAVGLGSLRRRKSDLRQNEFCGERAITASLSPPTLLYLSEKHSLWWALWWSACTRAWTACWPYFMNFLRSYLS